MSLNFLVAFICVHGILSIAWKNYISKVVEKIRDSAYLYKLEDYVISGRILDLVIYFLWMFEISNLVFLSKEIFQHSLE